MKKKYFLLFLCLSYAFCYGDQEPASKVASQQIVQGVSPEISVTTPSLLVEKVQASANTAKADQTELSTKPSPEKTAVAAEAKTPQKEVEPVEQLEFLPQGGLPGGFQEIATPAKFIKVDIGKGGKAPHAVGLDEKGTAYILNNDYNSWKPLNLTVKSTISSQNFTDYLKNETKVTIRVVSEGQWKNKYLRFVANDTKTEGYRMYMIANGDDAHDPECHFIIRRSSKHSWFGLTHANAGGNNLDAQAWGSWFRYKEFDQPDHDGQHFQIESSQPNRTDDVMINFAQSNRGYLTITPGAKITLEGQVVCNEYQKVDRGDEGSNQKPIRFAIEVVGTQRGKKSGEVTKILKDIAIGADGTIWAITSENGILRYTQGGWEQVEGNGTSISVGNQNEVWAIDDTDTIYRKKDPAQDNMYWGKTAGKSTGVTVGGDATTWAIGFDSSLYQFNRYNKTWMSIIRPQDFRMDAPRTLKVADFFNIVFSDLADNAWRLVPGKQGKNGDDWKKIPGEIKMKMISISSDGTMIGMRTDGKVIVRHPNEKDYKELTTGRGAEIRGGQIARITTGHNFNFRPVWTQASSAYDPNGKATPPEDHFELLVTQKIPEKLNDEKADYRHETSSFVSILHAGNPDSLDPIQFGENIEILSLYAAPGNESKAGIQGKTRIWWSHNPHIKWGKNANDILVTRNTHPQTRDGSQLFKIMSPTGQTGFVRSGDIVELQSLAPTSKNRKIFVSNVSRFEGYNEINAQSTGANDSWGQENLFFGNRETSGDQLFRFQAINKRDEVPLTAKTPSFATDPKLKVTPLDVFDALAETGQFWRKAEIVAQEKKVALETKADYGITILEQLRNETAYALSAEDLGTVNKEDALTGLERKFLSTLTLKGFTQDARIENFGSEKMVKLNKMFSKGFAWVEESLQKPGKTTVTFLARATDKGGVQVVFASKLETDADIRIIIGAVNNTKAQIIYKDPETGQLLLIAEADGILTPLAKAIPGRFMPYWVSIHDGNIMVGMGQPGESIFLSGFLPHPVPVNRFGFSSHDAPVDYAEIQTTDSLTSLVEETTYKKLDVKVDLPADPKGKPTFINLPMRVPNEGSFSFDIQAKESGTVVFANEKGDNYKIIFGANDNKNLILMRNDEVAIVQNVSMVKEAYLSETKALTFWATLVGGQLLIGRGKLGNNLMLAWQDSLPLSTITKFGIQPSSVPQSVSNFVTAPPVTLGTENAEPAYKNRIQRFEYRGGMIIIRPFEYQIAQIGKSTVLKNLLSGRVFNVLATPQQGGLYKAILSLDAQGLPSIAMASQPEDAPAKVELEKGAMLDEINADFKNTIANADAMLLDATAAGLHRSADTMIQGSTSFNAGIAVASFATAAGASLGALGAGVGAAALRRQGAQQQADLIKQAKEKQLQAKFGFDAHDSYVLVEQPTADVGGTESAVPDAAIQNQQIIRQKLDETLQADWSNPEQAMLLIRVYQDIINRINHPFVVQDGALKKRLMGDLEKFVRHYKEATHHYEDLIGLLVSAFTNVYLINKNEKTDVDAKERWYNTVAELGDLLLRSMTAKPESEITIPPLWGEYLWFPGELTEGKGAITLQAAGQNDLFFCFSQDVTDVRNSDEKLYEVVIGGFNNKKTVVRIKSLGRSAVESTDKQLTLHPLRPKTYWLSFDNGSVQVGSGQTVGENVILSWSDPYPWKKIAYLGIGTWDAPIKISRLASTVYTQNQAQADFGMTPSEETQQPQAANEQALAAAADQTQAGSEQAAAGPDQAQAESDQTQTPVEQATQGE